MEPVQAKEGGPWTPSTDLVHGGGGGVNARLRLNGQSIFSKVAVNLKKCSTVDNWTVRKG